MPLITAHKRASDLLKMLGVRGDGVITRQLVNVGIYLPVYAYLYVRAYVYVCFWHVSLIQLAP